MKIAELIALCFSFGLHIKGKIKVVDAVAGFG
jgi:hypothetical protein